MESLLLFRCAILGLGAMAAIGFSRLCLSVPVPPTPRLGRQGQQRQRAMATQGWFNALEPSLRYLAGILSMLPLGQLRAKQQRQLRAAGYPLGIEPNELSALSCVSSVVVATLFGIIADLMGKGSGYTALGALLGVMLPTLRIAELTKQRVKVICRALPNAIEIAAMCMGAGLDFPGALRLVAQPASSGINPLAQELSLVLEELEVGHTRREALRAFSERVPSDSVRDFANAVIQAEEKGNPLAQVLQIQGRVLNQRRSTLAEEAAAQAGVKLVIPMMLLVCCVLVLLVGPALLVSGSF